MKQIRLHFQNPGRRGAGRCYETLLKEAQDGSQEAREDLCQFVFDASLKYARSVGLPALYDLEDFAQDLVVEFVQQLGRIKFLRNWLPAVLIRQRALAFRRYHDRLMSRLEESDSKMKAEQLSAAEESRQTAHLDFQIVVNRLPQPHKDIVILHCVDCLRFEDISKILGLKPGNVRMHFLRTKRRLRNYLNFHGRDSSHGIVTSGTSETAARAAR